MGWQPIETVRGREGKFLAWYDHDADTYQSPDSPDKLTDYAVWAESGDFLSGRGVCFAVWQGPHFEAEDEYGGGFWMPAYTFAWENNDCERVVNATHWMPLPDAPTASEVA